MGLVGDHCALNGDLIQMGNKAFSCLSRLVCVYKTLGIVGNRQVTWRQTNCKCKSKCCLLL